MHRTIVLRHWLISGDSTVVATVTENPSGTLWITTESDDLFPIPLIEVIERTKDRPTRADLWEEIRRRFPGLSVELTPEYVDSLPAGYTDVYFPHP